MAIPKDIENRFKVLYRETRQRFFAFGRGYVLNGDVNEDELDDFLQEGMMTLYEQIVDGTYKEQGTMGSYLFRICRNKLLNYLRNKSKMPLDSISLMATELADQYMNDEEREIVLNTIRKLLEEAASTDCGEVLNFFYGKDNISMSEIAQELHYVNANVAKSKRYRCTERFKVALRSCLLEVDINWKMKNEK